MMINKRIKIAVPKGRLFDKSVSMLEKSGIKFESRQERKLSLSSINFPLSILIVRSKDVITYVDYKACDLGIVGLDLIREYEPDLLNVADLKFGKCRMVVAEPIDHPTYWRPIKRIATKFPHITESFFAKQGSPVEIISLYGSIELAPLYGLSDQIVDIVDTGRTLKENKLHVVDEIFSSTAHLIANPILCKLNHKLIDEIAEHFVRFL